MNKTTTAHYYPWALGAVLALMTLISTILAAQSSIPSPAQPNIPTPTCTPGTYDKDNKYVENPDCTKEYNAYTDQQTKATNDFQTSQKKSNAEQVGIAVIIAIVLSLIVYFFGRTMLILRALAVGSVFGLVGLVLLQLPTYVPGVRATALGLMLIALLAVGWTLLETDQIGPKA